MDNEDDDDDKIEDEDLNDGNGSDVITPLMMMAWKAQLTPLT